MPDAERMPRVAVCLLAVACMAVVLLPFPTWARTPFALCLVLWLPGRSLLGLALPRAVPNAETRVLAVALSLALTVLTGLALNVANALDATGWGLALSGLSLLAVALTPAVNPRDVAEGGTGLPAAPAWRFRDLALVAAGIALGLGAYAMARDGARKHDQYRYTEMWMIPVGPNPGSSAILGLRNSERSTTTYDVEVLDGGQVVGRWPRVSLAAGETMTMPVNATRGKEHRRLEARLFKDGNRDVVYRQVWIDVPPEANPATAKD
jgi:uncharacterized membrane protein